MSSLSAFTLGVAAGSIAILSFVRFHRGRQTSPALAEAEDRRQRLPQYVILVRHGESEGNADHTLFRSMPDNLVGLTDRGRQQAEDAGRRVESILMKNNMDRIHLVVSPFERTLQTARAMRNTLDHRIARTEVESRIREQEFGNLQGEDFLQMREEQNKVGRFWYRFPTGESGADVYDRVKSWWCESVQTVNLRVGYEPVDALVVVTHGLTMRLIMMQLFCWSPTTFHSVWNADNCDIYAFRKDLSKPGISPYTLDETNGDAPRSTIDLLVEYKSPEQEPQVLRLENYLTVPPPRSTRMDILKKMLAEQHSIDTETVESVTVMPFIDGAVVQRRTSSRATEMIDWNNTLKIDGEPLSSSVIREESTRFPNF